MKTTINLATRPFVNYRPFLVGTGLAVFLAVGVTVGLAIASAHAWQERTTARTRIGELKERHHQLTEQQREVEATLLDPNTQRRLERVRFLNQMIQRKVFPWTHLFFDLQEMLPGDARILSLAPSHRPDGRLQVEIQMGSEGPEAVIEFVQNLEKSEKFQGGVELQSQTVSTGSERDPMKAQIRAVYARE
jgi:type IV pilus assembly protein PilN